MPEEKQEGVYIIQKFNIFAPPPHFVQNNIFSPKYSENVSFSPVFHPLSPYFRVFS